MLLRFVLLAFFLCQPLYFSGSASAKSVALVGTTLSDVSTKDLSLVGDMKHSTVSSNIYSDHSGIDSDSDINTSAASVNKQEATRARKVEDGVYRLFPGFYYVSPMIVDDLSKYPVRMNFYGQITAGTLITVGPGIYRPETYGQPDTMAYNYGTNAFFQFRFGLGLELIIHHFYFGFGIDAYGLIGGIAPSGAIAFKSGSTIISSAGQQEWVFGYKWRFMLGGIVYFGNNKYVKIYASYSDAQLQVGGGLSQIFGYFSRTPGVGVMFRLAKGFEFGVEADFTLMHAGALGNNAGYVDFPAALIQGVLRIGF